MGPELVLSSVLSAQKLVGKVHCNCDRFGILSRKSARTRRKQAVDEQKSCSLDVSQTRAGRAEASKNNLPEREEKRQIHRPAALGLEVPSVTKSKSGEEAAASGLRISQSRSRRNSEFVRRRIRRVCGTWAWAYVSLLPASHKGMIIEGRRTSQQLNVLYPTQEGYLKKCLSRLTAHHLPTPSINLMLLPLRLSRSCGLSATPAPLGMLRDNTPTILIQQTSPILQSNPINLVFVLRIVAK